MTVRPDLHKPNHDAWDQGGYCNELVLDYDGCGTICGYRTPHTSHVPTVELDIQDSDGNTITTLELFDDVYARMTIEAATRGVTVGAHIVGIITDAARRITEDTENTE